MRPVVPALLTALLAAVPGTVCPGASAAQTVRGRVLEAETGAAVVGAELLILTEDGVPRVRGFSDTAGGFVLEAPTDGDYRLQVRHIGYAPFTSDVLEVYRDDAVTVMVRLGVSAIPLDPLVVVGRMGPEEGHLLAFQQRRLDPGRVGGYFLTRAEIDRRPHATPSQLLLGVPGVTLQRINNSGAFTMDRSVIRMAAGNTGSIGGCRANVFVDGSAVAQSETASVDDLLDATLIGGVEVYPRPITAPLQYQRDTGCGVVLFWTRRPGGGRRSRSHTLRWVLGTAAAVALGIGFSQVWW